MATSSEVVAKFIRLNAQPVIGSVNTITGPVNLTHQQFQEIFWPDHFNCVYSTLHEHEGKIDPLIENPDNEAVIKLFQISDDIRGYKFTQTVAPDETVFKWLMNRTYTVDALLARLINRPAYLMINCLRCANALVDDCRGVDNIYYIDKIFTDQIAALLTVETVHVTANILKLANLLTIDSQTLPNLTRDSGSYFGRLPLDLVTYLIKPYALKGAKW